MMFHGAIQSSVHRTKTFPTLAVQDFRDGFAYIFLFRNEYTPLKVTAIREQYNHDKMPSQLLKMQSCRRLETEFHHQ